MEITIQINGQALPMEVSIEVYTFLDQAAHTYPPEQIACRKETMSDKIMRLIKRDIDTK